MVDQQLHKIKTNALSIAKCNPWVLRGFAQRRARGFITCTGKTDGAGAQALARLSTMTFARDAGFQYVHTPFNWIEHNASNDSLWEQKWEDFFNLGKDELGIEACKQLGINIVQVDNLYDIPLTTSDVLYVVSQCHKYTNFFPNRYSNLGAALIEKYTSSPKHHYPLYGVDGKVNIAIHVRRGDVASSGSTAFRYTDNAKVYALVKTVLQSLSELGLSASVSLYSEGEIRDFGEMSDLGIDFHLNECVFTTFHNLVSADLLIMSKSTFSYVAALLSKGIKLYEPFAHRPLKQWISVDSNAQFSRRRLKAQLSHSLAF